MTLPAPRPIRLFIVTGEPSGDALAAAFVREWRAHHPHEVLELFGVGGPELAGEGLQSIFPQSDIAVMGFTAVLRRLRLILARIRQTVAAALTLAPDLVLTIDAPDFGLRVTRQLRKRAPAIPIVHWVCPSVWAWRPGRAARMRPHVDRILALLPFEPERLRELGGPETVYVGHPLIARIDTLTPNRDEADIRAQADRPEILVLPGSRRSEVDRLLPVFAEALKLIADQVPGARFVLPAVEHLADRIAAETTGWPVPVAILRGTGPKLAAFRRARAALAASGTVTLELALARVPMVAGYRVRAIEASIVRRLIKVTTVLLPNLILGRKVVPEFIQQDCTPQALAQAVLAILPDSPARKAQLQAFDAMHDAMRLDDGESPAARAVERVREILASRRAS